MKFFIMICNWMKRGLDWIHKNNNLTTLILTLLSLYIAYKSLKLADYSLNYSIKQNDKNSQISDSLFKVQLKNSKRLNDSIIYEIEKLKRVTDNQLEITQNQLIELKRLSKPRIAMTSFWLGTSSYDITKTEFFCEFSVINVGNRVANNLSYSLTFIRTNFTDVIDKENCLIYNSLNSNETYTHNLKFQFQNENSKEFFIHLKLTYYDKELNEKESLDYYYKYDQDSDSEFKTNKCNLEEIKRLQNR